MKKQNNETDATERRGVQSIELGAKLLSVLAEVSQPLMLKELAHKAGFAQARAHAYLVSFRKIGLVDQDPETGRYHLGPFALDIGIARMRIADPMHDAINCATVLNKRTQLNAAVVVWGSSGATVIQTVESSSHFNMTTRPGAIFSFSGSASGRVFAAYLPEKIVSEALRRERQDASKSGQIGTPMPLSKADIEKIRRRGYAAIDRLAVPGMKAYAAPVFNHAGQLMFAITIFGREALVIEKAESEYIPALLEETRKLSLDFGYIPDDKETCA